jgi:hypothetical protein
MSATQFRSELETLINCQSMENGSDTPDFILADYLVDCLAAYDRALQTREKWYGRAPKPVEGYGPIGLAGPDGEPPHWLTPPPPEDNIVRDSEGRSIGVKGNLGPSGCPSGPPGVAGPPGEGPLSESLRDKNRWPST